MTPEVMEKKGLQKLMKSRTPEVKESRLIDSELSDAVFIS